MSFLAFLVALIFCKDKHLIPIEKVHLVDFNILSNIFILENHFGECLMLATKPWEAFVPECASPLFEKLRLLTKCPSQGFPQPHLSLVSTLPFLTIFSFYDSNLLFLTILSFHLSNLYTNSGCKELYLDLTIPHS